MKNSTSASTGETAVARDHLIAEHIGLVHHIARKLSRSLSTEANFDELVSLGTIGLMKAIPSFDPGRGLAFSTYAAPKIRGAILDELRRQDYVPRSVRRKNRDLAAARKALTASLGREPHDREMADHLGLEMKTFWQWQAHAESIVRVSLDRPRQDTDRPQTSAVNELADRNHHSIEDLINHEEEVAVLKSAIMDLKEQERVVLTLYYFEELKLHEIAAILELTESRISQIRAKAILKLRAMIASLRQEESIAA